MSKFLSTLALTVLLLSGTVGAQPPITVSTRVMISPTPGYFRLRITVPRDERNRRVCLSWAQIQNGTAERISCWDHDGTAPLTTWRNIKDLDAGKWIVRAGVLRNDEKWTVSAPIIVHVTGFGYEPGSPE